MKQHVFDLDRLRNNWDRAAHERPRSAQTPGFTPVDAAAQGDGVPNVLRQAVDDREAIARTWQQIRTLIAADYSAHAESLSPFVSELERMMQRLSDPTTAGDPTSLRADFSQAMADLEDLLEVYGGIGL